jgi:glucose/arabinose dehydrogenase
LTIEDEDGQSLYIADFDGDVLRFDGVSGEFLGLFAQGPASGANGLAFGPDGNLYVSFEIPSLVQRHERATGNFIDQFVPPGSGGLSAANDLLFGPDGHLYVASDSTNEVMRYNGATGAPLGTGTCVAGNPAAFVCAGSGGLDQPRGLAFGPDGYLYVGGQFTNQVKRYDGTTGVFIDTFASGGGLNNTEDLTFGPDGHLYVSSRGTSQVLRFNGITGAFMDVFASGGGLAQPIGLVFGLDGHLYVISNGARQALRYNGTTGAFMGPFTPTGSGEPTNPTYLIFGP